jgi:hypothetical protein
MGEFTMGGAREGRNRGKPKERRGRISEKYRGRLKVEGTQREGIIKKQPKDVRLPPKN